MSGANGKQPGIDARRRTWTSPSAGLVLKLKPVSVGIMERIRSDRTGKPSVPKVLVDYGGEKGWEANPNDVTYREEMADWTSDRTIRLSVYTYGVGVDVEVPSSFKDEIAPWHSDPTDSELRYYYVTSLVPPNEYESLTNAILGQTSPTEDGIADAVASFPGTGQR